MCVYSTYLAEDAKGRVVGYVLCKMDFDETAHGHVTSLAVARSHRRLGIATKLMRQTQKSMSETYDAEYCSLHVRETNKVAFHLYHRTLGFEIYETEEEYYADGEDAYEMRKYLGKWADKRAAQLAKEKAENEALAIEQ